MSTVKVKLTVKDAELIRDNLFDYDDYLDGTLDPDPDPEALERAVTIIKKALARAYLKQHLGHK